jgi:aquaporin Z
VIPAKLLVEFIGTFILTLTTGMTGLTGLTGVYFGAAASWFGPMVIAGVLTVMIFAVRNISGAHFNPAVTLALTLQGDFPRKNAGPYMVAQILAAVLAGFLVLAVNGAMAAEELVVAPLELAAIPTLVFEIFFTFALISVILIVATTKDFAGHRFFDIFVGLTVFVGSYVAGPVSGGAFNPAVTFGLATMGFLNLSDTWMHFCGQFTGAFVAVAVFSVTMKPSTRDE